MTYCLNILERDLVVIKKKQGIFMYQNQNLSGRFCFLLLFKKIMLVRLAIFLSNSQKELKDISVRGGRGGWGIEKGYIFLIWFCSCCGMYAIILFNLKI